MNHTLKYGSGSLHLEIPDTCDVSVFTPQQVEPLDKPLAVFMNALDAPEGCPALENMPTPESVAIAVPDETRPFPIKLLLPPLLERIFSSYPSLPPHKVRKLRERFTDHKSLLKDFGQQEFKMGAHKAFLFSRVAAQHELVLHTALSEADAGRCLLRKNA